MHPAVHHTAKSQPAFRMMTLGVQELNPHLTLAPIRIHTTVDHLKELVLSATLVVLLQVFSISVCITNAKSKFVSHFLIKNIDHNVKHRSCKFK